MICLYDLDVAFYSTYLPVLHSLPYEDDVNPPTYTWFTTYSDELSLSA